MQRNVASSFVSDQIGEPTVVVRALPAAAATLFADEGHLVCVCDDVTNPRLKQLPRPQVSSRQVPQDSLSGSNHGSRAVIFLKVQRHHRGAAKKERRLRGLAAGSPGALSPQPPSRTGRGRDAQREAQEFL